MDNRMQTYIEIERQLREAERLQKRDQHMREVNSGHLGIIRYYLYGMRSFNRKLFYQMALKEEKGNSTAIGISGRWNEWVDEFVKIVTELTKLDFFPDLGDQYWHYELYTYVDNEPTQSLKEGRILDYPIRTYAPIPLSRESIYRRHIVLVTNEPEDTRTQRLIDAWKITYNLILIDFSPSEEEMEVIKSHSRTREYYGKEYPIPLLVKLEGDSAGFLYLSAKPD